MSIKRLARLGGVALVGALALTACGSDNNSSTGAGGAGSTSESSSAAAADACGTGSLNAEGSSAQKNAIEEAISSFGDTCSGATVNYNPTGSGAGIQQFTAGQVDFAGSDSALNSDKGEVDADGFLRITGRIAGAMAAAGVYDLNRIALPDLRRIVQAHVTEFCEAEKLTFDDAAKERLALEILAGMNR